MHIHRRMHMRMRIRIRTLLPAIQKNSIAISPLYRSKPTRGALDVGPLHAAVFPCDSSIPYFQSGAQDPNNPSPDGGDIAANAPGGAATTTTATRPPQVVLALRKWFDIKPCFEFRCFVREGRLVAVSQRDTSNFYEFLLEKELQVCAFLSAPVSPVLFVLDRGEG